MINRLKNTVYKLLRKSEKYAKTDMVYLAQGGFWLTFGQVISSASAFLLAIAFANLLPKETFGNYKYILSIAAILSIINLPGMNNAIAQSVARGYEGKFLPALKLKIKWGFIAIVGSIGISIYYYIIHNNTLAISFLIIAIFLPFIESFVLYYSYLQGKKLFSISVIYKSLTQILASISIVICLFFTQNIFIIIFIYFFSWTSIRYLFFLRTIKKYPPNDKIDNKIISYGKHNSLTTIISTITGALDAPILFHYLGVTELAIYSLALSPVNQIKELFNKIPILVMPKLAQRTSKEINTILWKRSLFLLLLGMFFSIVYILMAPFLFRTFFPQYIDAIFLSQIFSITIMLTLGKTILRSALNSKLTITPKKLLYLFNLPNIVMLLAIIVLIKDYGIIGVILGKIFAIITEITLSIIVWHVIKNAENTTNMTPVDTL